MPKAYVFRLWHFFGLGTPTLSNKWTFLVHGMKKKTFLAAMFLVSLQSEATFLFMNSQREHMMFSVADPGFPVGGGMDLIGGAWTPRQLRFENFACQNERIWTRRGALAGRAPLDPPMVLYACR